MPPTITLTAYPEIITVGESSFLTWEARNATRVAVSGVGWTTRLRGTIRVTPRTTTQYIAIAEDAAGERAEARVIVRVLPPVGVGGAAPGIPPTVPVPGPLGRIVVFLTDKYTGKPIVNGSVTDGFRPGVHVESGRYEIHNVPQGDYEVRATAPYYKAGAGRVFVPAGETVEIRLGLTQIRGVGRILERIWWFGAKPEALRPTAETERGIKFRGLKGVKAQLPWRGVSKKEKAKTIGKLFSPTTYFTGPREILMRVPIALIVGGIFTLIAMLAAPWLGFYLLLAIFFAIFFMVLSIWWGKYAETSYLLHIGIAASFAAIATLLFFDIFGKTLGVFLLPVGIFDPRLIWFILFILIFASSWGKGPGKTIFISSLYIGIAYVALLLISFVTSPAFFQLESYLAALDYLQYVGVPMSAINTFKQGIRQTLEYLGMQAIKKPVPEAEKIGGWQAIEVMFGSKYADYRLPTLFANLNYTLPLTIRNPNPIDSKLTVKNFAIEKAYMLNKSYRIMCGVASDCKVENPCNLEPEREKIISIDFLDEKNCMDLKMELSQVTYTFERIESEELCKDNCIYILGKCIGIPKNCSDIKVKEECEKQDGCTWDDERKSCNGEAEECKFFREVKSCGKTTDEPQYGCEWKKTSLLENYTYDKEKKICRCKIRRTLNNPYELCTVEKAVFNINTNFSFPVDGNSEFRIIQKEEDVKYLKAPKITSSAGPLSVTVYFVPDYYSFEKKQSIKMFVGVKNGGEGSARINDINVAQIPQDGIGFTNLNDCQKKLKEMLRYVNPDERIDVPCDLSLSPNIQALMKDKTFVTIPITVQVNYTYSQTYSISIPTYRILRSELLCEDVERYQNLSYFCPIGECRY